jgi:hypothetical protein
LCYVVHGGIKIIPERDEHSEGGALLVESREFVGSTVTVPLGFDSEGDVQRRDEQAGDAAK